MLLKVASLARGYSGVRPEVVDAMVALLQRRASIRAFRRRARSAPRATWRRSRTCRAVLLGLGEGAPQGHRCHARARTPCKLAGLKPLTLGPKEGLALLNGTQVSTALALSGLFAAENVFAAALVAGAMSRRCRDGQRHAVRCAHPRAARPAGTDRGRRRLSPLLAGSAIRASHLTGDDKVQDPYSLRCQPQVMGACLDVMRNAARTLLIEANGVTDNPLVFPETGESLSGGNFHAEPVAFAADHLALAIAEIGALSERRIALLIDPACQRPAAVPHRPRA